MCRAISQILRRAECARPDGRELVPVVLSSRQRHAGPRFDPARLSEAASGAAAALGLEVFGGDAIIKADGEPMIIDLNAWPSYALYRDRAAQAIADCLTERFQRRPRLVASGRN